MIRSLIRKTSVAVGASLLLGVAYVIYQNAAPPKVAKINYDGGSITQGVQIDDASGLNKTWVSGVVHVDSEASVRAALTFARHHHLKVSIAGKRHSMGGQTLVRDGLVLDMTRFNRIRVDKEHRVVTVQSGATWVNIQDALNRQGLAVKAMQSISIFSVGGTLSVNGHGVAHRPGPIASTVRSMKVMLADGSIVRVSHDKNPELFRLIIGGYGLFGVILEAELEVVDNAFLRHSTTYMNYTDLPHFYARHIEQNSDVQMVYGRLSVSPDNFLKEMAIHSYLSAPEPLTYRPMYPETRVWLKRLIFNLSKMGSAGRWMRWKLEKYVEPVLYRNPDREYPHLETRNQVMYGGMAFLDSRLPRTDILQEYFIPPNQMVPFVDGLRDIVKRNHVNLLNAGFRVVHRDTISVLSYAPQDRFAFVLYFNQKLTDDESARLTKATQELINLAISLDGTFYLPYQLVYTPAQLHAAYPSINYFFSMKNKYDPDTRFSNLFYEHYGPNKNKL